MGEVHLLPGRRHLQGHQLGSNRKGDLPADQSIIVGLQLARGGSGSIASSHTVEGIRPSRHRCSG